MKTTIKALLLIIWLAVAGYAQTTTPDPNPAADPTLSFFLVRTGIRTDAPHVATYRYAEFFQIRGKWIYPDVGYIDFGTGDYREWYIGGGATLYDKKGLSVVEEFYYDQATGPAAKSAKYFQPWTLVDVKLSPKVATEIVYFPYVPLNQPARVQHVLERAKIEYQVAKKWKVGGGYAGYQFGDGSWQNKPMLTVTRSTEKLGSLEVWLQKMPGGAQIQMRYQLIHAGHAAKRH